MDDCMQVNNKARSVDHKLLSLAVIGLAVKAPCYCIGARSDGKELLSLAVQFLSLAVIVHAVKAPWYCI